MRIGIFPTSDRHGGGIYQYSTNLLRGLYAWSAGDLSGTELCSDDFVILAHEPEAFDVPESLKDRWQVRSFRPPWAPDPGVKQPVRPEVDTVQSQPDMRRWLEECGIDLMIYPWPHRLSFEAGIPYIMAVHDVQHRLQPEFNEVAGDGERERREYVFRNGIRYASRVLVDSPTGKQDILACYGAHGASPERIEVLPFLPAESMGRDQAESHRDRVVAAYDLPERFVFYPAQMWPHKNHVRIIEALGVLRRTAEITIPFVMTGSASGTLREANLQTVMNRGSELGVADQLIHLGYVPDEDIMGLYSAATALVMPTFFGPTNIPILEAWSLGCPVMTSDIRGIREQAGNAALLVDPRSVDAIADGLKSLWQDDHLRRQLIRRGTQRVSEYLPEDHDRLLVAIIKRAWAMREPSLLQEVSNV